MGPGTEDRASKDWKSPPGPSLMEQQRGRKGTAKPKWWEAGAAPIINRLSHALAQQFPGVAPEKGTQLFPIRGGRWTESYQLQGLFNRQSGEAEEDARK